MALPEPEPGLVISYSYLWRHEALRRLEEGRKDRPCVIVTAVERADNGGLIVTVLPVTHRPPENPAAAVEIPTPVKQRLGLDHERSWVIIDEGNRFAWPGYDLKKAAGRDTFEYGFLPPALFESVMAAARAWLKKHKINITPR
jgi:PemK-like, MazF-like toxin of type II toxin-antitoxin system